MKSEVELAWAAGFFEGEGSVRINVATVRNLGTLLVDVPNTDEGCVDFFVSRWGGSKKHVPAATNRREYWRWRLAAKAAREFLLELLPYIRSKKYHDRFVLGIEYQDQKETGRENRTDEYRARQVDYYNRMAALNKRGTQS